VTEIYQSSPVIVLGMHRSGTSIFTRILSDIGVFVGKDLNVHCESKFFMNLNNELLSGVHAYWDTPSNVLSIQDDPATDYLTDVIRRKIKSFSFTTSYLGWRNSIFNSVPQLWGWKDPRTILFIPLYADLFKKARFIFISRNGVDVARSLQNRELSRKNKDLNSIRSVRCRSLDRAFNLWQEYALIYLEGRKSIRPGGLLEIRYEDLLSNTTEILKGVTDFLDLNPLPRYLNDDVSKVLHRSRKYGFKNDESLMKYYAEVKNDELMKMWGYDVIE